MTQDMRKLLEAVTGWASDPNEQVDADDLFHRETVKRIMAWAYSFGYMDGAKMHDDNSPDEQIAQDMDKADAIAHKWVEEFGARHVDDIL